MESEPLVLVMEGIEEILETLVSFASSRRSRAGSYTCNGISCPIAGIASSV